MNDSRLLKVIVGIVGFVVVLLVVADLLLSDPGERPADSHSAPSVTGAGVVGPGMTDRALVGDLNAICARHAGGCGRHVTMAMLPDVVAFVCEAVAQTDVPEPVGNVAWVGAWRAIGPAVVGSGRCNGGR